MEKITQFTSKTIVLAIDDVDTDQIDMSTGEWLGSEPTPSTDFVDLKKLRA